MQYIQTWCGNGDSSLHWFESFRYSARLSMSACRLWNPVWSHDHKGSFPRFPLFLWNDEAQRDKPAGELCCTCSLVCPQRGVGACPSSSPISPLLTLHLPPPHRTPSRKKSNWRAGNGSTRVRLLMIMSLCSNCTKHSNRAERSVCNWLSNASASFLSLTDEWVFFCLCVEC